VGARGRGRRAGEICAYPAAMMSPATAPFRLRPFVEKRPSGCACAGASRLRRKGATPLDGGRDLSSAAPGSAARARLAESRPRAKEDAGEESPQGRRAAASAFPGGNRPSEASAPGWRSRATPPRLASIADFLRPGQALPVSPSQAPDRDFYLLRKACNLIPEDGFHANAVSASLFFLAGLMPLVCSPLAVPAARSNGKVPAEAGAADRL